MSHVVGTGMVDQFGLAGSDRGVGGLKSHRRLAQKLGEQCGLRDAARPQAVGAAHRLEHADNCAGDILSPANPASSERTTEVACRRTHTRGLFSRHRRDVVTGDLNFPLKEVIRETCTAESRFLPRLKSGASMEEFDEQRETACAGGW
jgi:hypothetical protein